MKKFINNKYFWRAYNENFYALIIIAILIIILLFIPFYVNNKKDKIDSERLDLSTLDLFDKDNIGQYVYIDIYEKPKLINYDKQYSKQVYVIQQNNKDYIVLLRQSDVDKLEETIQNKKVVRLYGYTKKADKEIRAKSLEFLRKKIERYNLDIDDFNKYLGCLYMHDSKYGELNDLIIFCYFMAIMLFGIGVYALYLVIRANVNIRKFNKKDLNIINQEVNAKSAIYYGGIYLCKSYLIDTMKVILYKYEDIEYIQIEDVKNRKLKITIGNSIYIKIKNKKKKSRINSVVLFEKAAENKDVFIEYIENNYPNIDII